MLVDWNKFGERLLDKDLLDVTLRNMNREQIEELVRTVLIYRERITDSFVEDWEWEHTGIFLTREIEDRGFRVWREGDDNLIKFELLKHLSMRFAVVNVNSHTNIALKHINDTEAFEIWLKEKDKEGSCSTL